MKNDDAPLIESEHLQKAADTLRTVAHPFRLQIIDILIRGERTVTELCHQLEAQQPYTSQQLNLMKAKQILSSRRDGNQVYYSIANPDVVSVIHCVRKRVSLEGNGAPKSGSQSEV